MKGKQDEMVQQISYVELKELHGTVATVPQKPAAKDSPTNKSGARKVGTYKKLRRDDNRAAASYIVNTTGVKRGAPMEVDYPCENKKAKEQMVGVREEGTRQKGGGVIPRKS